MAPLYRVIPENIAKAIMEDEDLKHIEVPISRYGIPRPFCLAIGENFMCMDGTMIVTQGVAYRIIWGIGYHPNGLTATMSLLNLQTGVEEDMLFNETLSPVCNDIQEEFYLKFKEIVSCYSQ